MNAFDLDALAGEVGASRSMLTRRFRRQYGISCFEYLTRVRLRWFVNEVREPGANAGRLAQQAGYQRYHNLLDALRRRTGLTPREARRLPHHEACALLDGQLALAHGLRS
jgi:AraC-like DNA-binding protein